MKNEYQSNDKVQVSGKEEQSRREQRRSQRAAARTGDSAEKERGKGRNSAEQPEEAYDALAFKKSLYGFDPEEVVDYINELNRNYSETCRMYDQKLEDSRDNLALLTRERETLNAQLSEIRGKFEAAQSELSRLREINSTSNKDAAVAESTQELVAVVSTLNAKITGLERDNAKLKDELERGRAALKENEKIKAENQEQKTQLAQNLVELDRLNGIAREAEDTIAENERLKVETQDSTKRLAEAKADLAKATEALSAVKPELSSLRKAVADYNVRKEMFEKQKKTFDEELTNLRATNKQQAYDFAQQRSELESKVSAERLELTKQVQVHSYHLSQSQLLLTELMKQFEQAQASFKGLERE